MKKWLRKWLRTWLGVDKLEEEVESLDVDFKDLQRHVDTLDYVDSAELHDALNDLRGDLEAQIDSIEESAGM